MVITRWITILLHFKAGDALHSYIIDPDHVQWNRRVIICRLMVSTLEVEFLQQQHYHKSNYNKSNYKVLQQ